MSKPAGLKDQMHKARAFKVARVIATAYQQGATAEQIEAYLVREDVTSDPQEVRVWAESLKRPRLLSPLELQSFGGLDALRALFGLPPAPPSTEEPKLPKFQMTESADSEYFAKVNAGTLCYDHLRERWLRVDPASGLWLPDTTEQTVQLALTAMRKRQVVAMLINNEHRTAAIEWTVRGENRSRLSNLIALAQSTSLADDGHHWDEHPFLLGCQNGVVDLSTGTFRKAKPEERITMRVSVAYDPDATCPQWEQALKDIFAGHDAPSANGLLDQPDRSESQRIVEFFQRAMGYSITGDCREECCFFAWGEGANGKGTTINTIGGLLGDYRDDMPYATLERNARAGGGIPNDVAKLAGKRFITCAEVQEFSINESRLKALTGRDPITARFLNKEFFTFEPVGKVWVATNNKPKITGTDDGIWRRIHLIPFTNKFEGPNRNLRLKDQLKDELPGILNWLIAGVKMWLEKGLDPPATVRAATEAYREESNPITPFIEARCVVLVGKKVQGQKIWEEYQTFCGGSDDSLSQKRFFQALGKRFKSEKNRAGQTEYVGLVLQVRSADNGS